MRMHRLQKEPSKRFFVVFGILSAVFAIGGVNLFLYDCNLRKSCSARVEAWRKPQQELRRAGVRVRIQRDVIPDREQCRDVSAPAESRRARESSGESRKSGNVCGGGKRALAACVRGDGRGGRAFSGNNRFRVCPGKTRLNPSPFRFTRKSPRGFPSTRTAFSAGT